MLVIDDSMFKLAKMQESLLKVTSSNREENLVNYKKTVAQIDAQAFAYILEEIKHIDEHNQSLEEEVQFLERIKSCYDQLLELQLSFRRVCELYGGEDLVLSDLSQLNIEYIDSRINTINGYLVNLRNISVNKAKVQELGEQLVVEEEKRDWLATRLLELEEELRRNFLNAEGRIIVSGELQYSSIVLEYKKLGLDFERLLREPESLSNLLAQAVRDEKEVRDELDTTQLCYDNVPSGENKQILDRVNLRALEAKYKLAMLKILERLSKNCDSYEDFINKRNDILDLISCRAKYLKGLGIQTPFDPFNGTKVLEQLKYVSSINDNTAVINRIRKEIGQLTIRTEEMIHQNSDYLISLSDTKALFESRVGMSDIDISRVDIPVENRLSLMDRVVAHNQVVGIREVSKLNMSIVRQKTSGVIKRVNQMISGSLESRTPVSEDATIFEPKLVIVPKVASKNDSTVGRKDTIDIVSDFSVPVELAPQKVESVSTLDTSKNDIDFSKLFETVDPFVEPERFSDRAEESLVSETSLSTAELQQIANKPKSNLELQYDDEAMPDAFWTTEEYEDDLVDEDEPSFDDQISALLSSDKPKVKTLDPWNSRKVA